MVEWAEGPIHSATNVSKVGLRNASGISPESYTINAGMGSEDRLSNALYQLLHLKRRSALVDTVMCGGDTDTNAAIAGALLGAVHGRTSIPDRWVDCILNVVRPTIKVESNVTTPEVFWPVDALEIAEALVLGKSKA